MAKVLVTGGAGFIGSHLCDLLVEAGHEVGIIDNLSTGKMTNLNAQAAFFETDLRSKEAVESVFEDFRPEAVFHLAAQASVAVSTKDPAFDVAVNVQGTVKLAQISQHFGVKHFLFASTGGAIYSPEATLPYDESTAPGPLSIYGLSKWSAERYLDYFARTSEMAVTILRLSNVFGPRQDSLGEAGVVSIFTDRMQRGEPVTIDSDGEQTRDFIYVADVVAAFATAHDKCLTGIYNVATGIETSVNQIYNWLEQATHYTLPRQHGPQRPNDMRSSVLSSAKLQAASNWRPRVALDTGIEKTVEWFGRQG